MTTTLQHTIRLLADLLQQENQALEAMDFARAGALLAPKHAAADALAAAWRAAATLDAPPADLRLLGELADENRRLLNRAMRVQRRVLDLVARAARTNQPATRYGRAGARAPEPPAPHSLATRA